MNTEAKSKPFPMSALLTAQFFGAFNDNAFKMIITLIGFAAVAEQGEVAQQEVTRNVMVALTLPLMLGSIPAVVYGDRVSKRSLIIWTKFAEVCLMALGMLVLWVEPAGWLPFIVLVGMGLQSAMFAPGKYGLLPEVISHEKLTAANGKLTSEKVRRAVEAEAEEEAAYTPSCIPGDDSVDEGQEHRQRQESTKNRPPLRPSRIRKEEQERAR